MLAIAKRTLTALTVIGILLAVPTSASAAWTHLGGDPLFPGGIPSTNQEGRDKFVHDMLSPRGVLAQKRAGLNKIERQAFKQALVHGEFQACTLNYGDHFKAMSFGVGTIFVDRDVTFADPRYRDHGSPAFCVTVRTKNSVTRVKVPLICENFSVVSTKKVRKPKPHKKHHKHHKHHKKPPAQVCSGNTNNQNIGTAAQGGNCSENTNITVCSPVNSPGSVVCNTTEEKAKPTKPTAELENIQEFEVEEGSYENPICGAVNPPAGDFVTVYFGAEYGSFWDGGKGAPLGGTNKYCNSSYHAPAALPPRRCTEAGLPSDAVWCDVVKMTVISSNGAENVTVEREVPIKEQTRF